MAVSGDIQTFSLVAIGRLMHAEKKTGVLKIVNEGEVIRFFFKNGHIIFVDGELERAFALETLLLSEHLITADSLQEAKNIAGQSTKDITRILIEKKIVAEEDLKRLFHFRLKETACKALTWQEGMFEYQDGLNDFQTVIPLKLDTVRFLAEAEKWREFRALIPNDYAVFRIKAAVDSRSESFSSPGVHRVMLMIDGVRNVYEIMEETGMARMMVYRALQLLIQQDVVELEKGREEMDSEKMFNRKVMLQYFARLVNEVMTNLTMELGRKKSESILDKGTQETSHATFFLQLLKAGEPTDTNVERMNAWMIERQQTIATQDIFNGFQKILLFLLDEEHQLLGFKSFKTTIQRAIALSEKAGSEERPIASSVLALLSSALKDRQELAGTNGSFDGLTTENGSRDERSVIPFPHLNQVGGAAIIAFYSRVLQIVTQDLETAIGSKVNDLLSEIITASQYNEKFLSQYHVTDDVKTNVERIRRHISDKGYRLSKISFIKGFQQALIALLLEEKQLLGIRPAIASIRKIESQILFFKQNEFKWLADHLLQTIQASGNFDTGG
jgi:hypothetical protein